MLGAYLTDRTPLTTARVRKRIQSGAPIYGTSPDRPVGAVRRVPYTQALSPEAYAALTVRPRQAGAPQRYVQDTGAIYQQVQALLIVWRKGGGPVSPPDFGDDPGDTSGDNTPRTEQAVRSFQKWANANGSDIRDDGVLDDLTIGQLVAVTAPMVQANTKTKSVWMMGGGLGLLLLGAGVGGLLLYSEYGRKGGR